MGVDKAEKYINIEKPVLYGLDEKIIGG